MWRVTDTEGVMFVAVVVVAVVGGQHRGSFQSIRCCSVSTAAPISMAKRFIDKATKAKLRTAGC
jgi:hypothetical protein